MPKLIVTASLALWESCQVVSPAWRGYVSLLGREDCQIHCAAADRARCSVCVLPLESGITVVLSGTTLL